MKRKKKDKKEEWETLAKFKTEVFDLKRHHNYNDVNAILPLAAPSSEDPFDFLTRDRKRQEGRTPTPFVKMVDTCSDFKSKHVEIGYFTPIHQNGDEGQYVEEKVWLREGVEIFNSASVNRTTIVLERNKDKIKFSIFKFAKTRQVGHRYFSKNSKDIHITFNLKTKNFFITLSKFGNRKRMTTTTKNDFLKIPSTVNPIHIDTLLNKIVWYTGGIPFPHPEEKEKLEIFLEKVRIQLKETLKINFSFKEGIGAGLGEGMMKWFITQWGIKVPNEYEQYLMFHYPGIRKLRKHKMNLVHTILNQKKLGGKYYIRLLNKSGRINLTDLLEVHRIFGAKYCKLVPFSFLNMTNCQVDSKWATLEETPYTPHALTKFEKLNLIKILRQVKDDTNFLTQIHDHFRIQSKLLEFGIKRRIKAQTLKEFDDEHLDWSNLIHLCERNKETVYQYDEEFIKYMEEDIVCDKEHHQVTILKTDLDYFDEGQHQHHCVRSYVDHYKSLIISVKKGKDRMTCEFAPHGVTHLGFILSPSSSTIPLHHIQSQLKFNKRPSGTWKNVSECLKNRLNFYFRDHSFEFPTIHLSNKVTGKKESLEWDKEESTFISTEGKKQNCGNEDLPF